MVRPYDGMLIGLSYASRPIIPTTVLCEIEAEL